MIDPLIQVVSTASAECYRTYARRFLETFAKFWPKNIILHFFYEPPLDFYEQHPIYNNIEYHDLFAKTAIQSFMADVAWMPSMMGGADGRDYRLQGARFSQKVYALTCPSLTDCGIRVWLDADTETVEPITEEWLQKVLPQPKDTATYLGRKDWHHSECGWVAYNLRKGGEIFLRDFLDVYATGLVAKYPETHDSYIFDRLRWKYENSGWTFRNLSPDARGLNVWPQSPLGEKMVHHKGHLKHLL